MTGTTISHYEILEQLGSGGMGVVYKARDVRLDRVVALKFLPAKVARDDETKQRFMQEAKAASSLDDPHICTIFDIDEAPDGQFFIAMAYYDGSTLSDLIEKRRIRIEDAASIARQMAKGLSSAHEAGIVHRDVKPANIMVTRSGLVKILDFGVAKLGESSNLTREGSTIGTASYMSPEQARGETLDARSDIWSIGAVLYEMLTGSRPFQGGYEAAVAYSIINTDPAPIEPARPDTPEGLVEIVQRALSKDPNERFPTARALADELAAYSGETVVETASHPAAPPTAAASALSLQRIAVRFSVIGVVVLAVVYALMIGLGLPDWVFPAAVLLTLVGLPIVLYSASVERKRERMDSGERARLAGLKARLSTRLAVRGGFIAAAGLLLAIAGYSVLRAAGVGPFASLISGGVLEDQGAIIVTDFRNRTGIEDLGLTVSEALRIDLSQSTAVRVVEQSQIQSALQRMNLNPDTLVDAEIGLRVAEREGVKAVIEGEVSSIGDAIQITARVIATEGRSQVAAYRENASNAEDALNAIDRLSAELREDIGESLVSIRSSPALERVTTSSLDALRSYTLAEQAQIQGRRDDARAAIRRAMEIDSTFGMAFRKAFVLGEGDIETRMDYLRRAFDLRNGMTERERLITESTYYWYQRDSRDGDRAIQTLEDMRQRWPDDLTGLNNLALMYNTRGRHEEAVPLLRRALGLAEGWTWRVNLIDGLTQLGRIEELEKELTTMESLYPGTTVPPDYRMHVAFSMDSLEAAHRWMDVRNNNARTDEDERTNVLPYERTDVLLAEGRIDEALSAWAEWEGTPDFATWKRVNAFADSVIDQRKKGFLRSRHRYVAMLIGDMTDFLPLRTEYLEDLAETEGDSVITWRNFNLGFAAIDFGRYGEADSLVARIDSLRATGLDFMDESAEEDLAELRILSRGFHGDDPAGAAAYLLENVLADRACKRCQREIVARLYEVAGDPARAIQYYTEFVTGLSRNAIFNDRGQAALAHFRLGELYEQQNDLDRAIHHYNKMVDRWENADDVLQPQVREARRRIEQLLDQRAREPAS